MNSESDVRRVEVFLQRGFRAPRGRELAMRYLEERLPGGEYLLCGASEESAAIYATLKQRTAIRFSAVVDRRAGTLGRWHGLPVVDHLKAAREFSARVLLVHPEFELDMRSDLLAAGVSASRILSVYSDKGFVDWALPRAQRELESRLAAVGPVPRLLISGGRPQWSVVADDTLRVWAEPGVRLFFGREGHREAAPKWREFDARLSVELVRTAIEKLQPEVIYLRVSYQFNNQGLAVWLRRRYPRIRLIVEVYDWALSLEDDMLQAWNLDEESVTAMRAAERFIASHADLLVVKNGGETWSRMTDDWPSRPLTVFPVISGNEPQEPSPGPRLDSPWRFLYAATLPTPGEVDSGGLLGCYGVLDTFELLARQGFEFEIRNSVHVHASQDAAFGDYLKRYRAGPVRYHRRLPLAELIERMSEFHFGWMVLERTRGEAPFIDLVTVPNRFAAFVAGGLPVVVEEEYAYVAELVRRFQAGVVIRFEERHHLSEKLSQIDYRNLRLGMARLREHLAATNRQAFCRISKALAGGRCAR